MILKRLFILLFIFIMLGCTAIPAGIEPVTNFNIQKYQGTWYELARLDHSFEKGLEKVSAQYQIKPNGDVTVINQGFLSETGKWRTANGNAKFVGSSDTGFLKVSFFGPFYGSYVIFELDESYQYAFVAGPNLSYLWLLSRSKKLEPKLKRHFIDRVESLGFDTEQLIWVQQSSDN